MNKIKKIFILCAFIFFTYIFTTAAFAASISISTSKNTVKPGESFTVTIKANNGAGPISATTSNGSGSLGKTWLDNSSASFTCTAGSSGTVTISASGVLGDYTTAEDQNVSASKTVKIEEKKSETTSTTTKSTNKSTTKTTNKVETKKEEAKKEKIKEEEKNEEIVEDTRYLLEKLKIKDANLKPEFNQEIYEYNIIVTEKEKLDLDLKANKDNTIIEVLGNENFKIGENEVNIILKGQDDKEFTTYKIKVVNEKSQLSIANEKIERLEKRVFKLSMIIIAFIITLSTIAIISIIKCKEDVKRG